MQFNPYAAAGAQVAAGLVNAPGASPTEIGALLARHEVHDPVPTGTQAAALVAWAGRLRPVFGPPPAVEQAARLNELLATAGCRPRLEAHDGLPFHLHYAPAGDDLVGRVAALTAAGLAHLVDAGGGDRLGRCARGGCGVVFVDTSRRGGRRFCGVRCANQVHVANHRARRAAPAATPGS